MKKIHFLSLPLMLSLALAACTAAPAAAPSSAPAATTASAAPADAATDAASSTTTAPAEATGETAASGTPVKISTFGPQGPDGDLATNSFTKEMEQKFGIQFEWQTTTLDGASAKEKRQISLASGDYPELFLLIPWVDQFSQSDLVKYGEQGVVLPLNDLIQKYAPNVMAALDKYPTFKTQATAPDGKIYGLPQLVECYHCSFANKMWMNTKWLKKLGLEMPKTTEDFKVVLEAFKTKDPNGNGKADEVPLSGSTEEYGVHVIPFLMNGFIYNDDRTYLLLKDGKVDIAATKPEWKEGLAYIKSLYDAGLIDPGAFTQNAEAFKKIGDNADASILGLGAGMHPAIFVSTGAGSLYGADYDPLPPLQGPHAAYATYNYPSVAGATFVLTNKASEAAQIAAIKMVDYLFTPEGAIRGIFGEEGKDWRGPQEGDKALAEDAKPLYAGIPLPEGETPHNSAWSAMAQYYNPKDFRDASIQGQDIYVPQGYERRLQQATDMYAPQQPKEVFPHWAIWVDSAVADEAATLRTNISDYVNQNALQFVTGAKSLDTEWDAYIAGLDQLNLTRYLEVMQQSYDASFKK